MPPLHYTRFLCAPVNLTMNGAAQQVIPAPGVGLRIEISHLVLTLGAAGTCRLHDATPTDFTGDMSESWRDWRDNEPMFVCAENTAMQVTGTNGVALAGYMLYRAEEVR